MQTYKLELATNLTLNPFFISTLMPSSVTDAYTYARTSKTNDLARENSPKGSYRPNNLSCAVRYSK